MHAATAASVLAISARQVQWLLRRYREDGAGAIRHGLRGRPSNNRIGTGLRDYALCLVRETYVDFGPTLASEKLAERHGLQVSAETLRKWMIADAAVTENKRLSEVLAYAMALQQATAPNVPPAGKQNSRYEPTGKKPPGRKSWLDKRAERRAAEAAAHHAAE